MKDLIVIGGGFAGVEAAWQAARAGARVRLYEMRPVRQTPAHRTDKLGEIVCSNSLKSDEPGTAPYLLKEELRRGGSIVMEAAAATRVPAGGALGGVRDKIWGVLKEELRRGGSIVMEAAAATRVPAGAALAVDRHKFAEFLTERVEAHPNIEVVREEGTRVPRDSITVIATGPLTSEALTSAIMKVTGD